MEIREDVNHDHGIEAELQALCYEYAWQRKRWRVWRDSRYIANFSPDPQTEDRRAEEPSARTSGKGGQHPGADTLGDFISVARRSKAKHARPLHLKRSGPSSDGEHRPAQDPPPAAAAAVLPHAFLPLSEVKWPALGSASAAYPATYGLPETGPRSSTLRWTELS